MRKERKIKGFMKILKNSKLVSEESCSYLIKNFSHISANLFKNYLKNNEEVLGSIHATDIKELAISLHDYSPRALMFLRKHLSLPHPSTIRSWSAGISYEPGFLKKPLLCLADLVEDGQEDFVLIIDEMSIKKETRWEPKIQQFVATVDYGNIKAENPDNTASHVL